jgi:hypothetical protein
VEALQLERDQQHRASATLIADLIVLCLTHSDSQAVVDGVPQEPVRAALLAKYRATLSKAERRCRRQVEELFYYQHLQRHEVAMELDEDDLFNVENWYLWGLSKNSLLVVAATSGALVAGGAGMAVDAATGGLLGGMGTMISGLGGALLSGAGAWKYSESIGDITVKGIPTGGQRLTMGPSPNLNFPFVVLGRALEHHRMLARRTHAHREVMQLDSPLLDHVSESDRKQLGKLFAQIRKGKPLPRQQSELTELIYGYALAVDHPEANR